MNVPQTQIFGDSLTVREAAAKLRVTCRQVRWLLKEGRLPGSFKVGMLRLIPKQSVEDRAARAINQYPGKREGKAHHAK